MPASVGPRARVVIVTLDNHLSGAVERAAAAFARDRLPIDIGFHAAADWDVPAHLDAARADIGRADIVLTTMMFLDDHIRAILPALTARREQCDAMLGLMSSSDVVKLTKIGGYRMDAPAKGPMAFLKKLRGKPAKPGEAPAAGAGEKQMKMLRRLPKILKYIPGTAQDVRQYFLTLQYWLAGSDENVAQMIRALVDRYADGPRRPLRGTLNPQRPREYPDAGVYHPAMPGRIGASATALPRNKVARGTVGIVLLRSYVLANDSAHYDGVIAALEAKGLNVVPAFAAGLDARPAIEAFFLKDGKPTVDALISLTGFSLVGGPAYNDAAAAEAILSKLDVPYLAAHPVEFQSLQAWGASRQGLLPLESTIMVAIPELDGATNPMIFGGRADASGPCTGCDRACAFAEHGLVREMRACPERADALAAKTAKLVALRRTPVAERKVATVLFNFPPNAGATGTAAYLGVWPSLLNTLRAMRDEGYTVDVPASVDDLRNAVLTGNAARFGADANVHARVTADHIVQTELHLAEIEAVWGPAPGKLQSDGGHVHIYGAKFGNVFVGIQPAFGLEGDPMRLLFEGAFSPTHAFVAFYRWLANDFQADALLHFGTHGALEWMSGKQVGLSARCWPERLVADTPNVYLYAANNPSEGMLAKRRSAATLVSYLTPPIAAAGLYRGLLDLKAAIDRWRSAAPHELADLAQMIHAQAAACDLADEQAPWLDPATEIPMLAARLYEYEEALIPNGLHVLGQPPSPAERADLLAAMATARGETVARADLEAIVAGAPGATPLHAELAAADRLLAVDHELPALLHALGGGFTRPTPGGDLLRTPAILPTGRNLHGFDPFRLPSAFAQKDGAAQATRLLDRHAAETGAYPRAIAMVLWGTDNLKSEGAQIAQALALMGARARFDSYGRLAGAELIPLVDLTRPRVDVVATLSGIFRDLLPLQTRMLAEAAWLAANADEPAHMNPIRAHALAHAEAHGCDLETAALRVFSNAEGAYGANVNALIDSGAWTDPDELAHAYETRKGFAYGRTGKPAKQGAIMKSALADCDLAYQNLESVEAGITSLDQYVDALGGVSRAMTKARGTAAPVYIGDQTQGAGKVRTLNEQVALETRTRALNPRWQEGVLRSGYEGVRQIEAHVTTTMGWSATTGQVDPWIYQRLSETYVLDDAMRERLTALNPKATAKMAGRLIEASDRKYWTPDAATLAALHDAADAIEDALEGISA